MGEQGSMYWVVGLLVLAALVCLPLANKGNDEHRYQTRGSIPAAYTSVKLLEEDGGEAAPPEPEEEEPADETQQTDAETEGPGSLEDSPEQAEPEEKVQIIYGPQIDIDAIWENEPEDIAIPDDLTDLQLAYLKSIDYRLALFEQILYLAIAGLAVWFIFHSISPLIR